MNRVKRLITVIALVGAVMVSGFSGAAKADINGFTPTCGTNSNRWAISFQMTYTSGDVTPWKIGTYYNCGSYGTFLMEGQVSTDGGNHWNDLAEFYVTVSPSDANLDKLTYRKWGGTTCNANYIYRMKTWPAVWADATVSYLVPGGLPGCG